MKNQSKNKKADRRKLGWVMAGVLSFVLSSPALALDLDRAIAEQEGDAAQIVSTLDQKPNVQTSKDTEKVVRVHLLRKKKIKKYALLNQ